MLLPNSVKVYIATEAVDMRKSFDGLSQLVQLELELNAVSGHLFVFHNRRGDKIKLLYWDRNGFCIWYKRLESGRFRFPRIVENHCVVTPHDLNLLLEGIELSSKQGLPAVAISLVA